MTLASGRQTFDQRHASIETAPKLFSDGSQIVLSDRSGSRQLYIMSANGGAAKRISFGDGRYARPYGHRVRHDRITKRKQRTFHIGVMRTDGSEERLLTASFLDEGPTWSPNGRVIIFTTKPQGCHPSAKQIYYSVIFQVATLSRCQRLRADLILPGHRWENSAICIESELWYK